MYAIDFEYDGLKLSEFNMIICDFNASNSVDTVSSGADITFNQIKPSKSQAKIKPGNLIDHVATAKNTSLTNESVKMQ